MKKILLLATMAMVLGSCGGSSKQVEKLPGEDLPPIQESVPCIQDSVSTCCNSTDTIIK